MSVTATSAPTLALALEQANPNTIADALRLVNLSKMVEPQKLLVDQAAATTVTLDPAALMVQSVRVTAGASTGRRVVSDAADTASTSVCLLSDDGSTLTFEGNVTEAIIVYVARSEAALDSLFPSSPSK